MAARKNPKTAIEIGVNERPAVEGLKRLASDFGTASVKINQSLEIAQKGFSALTGAIGGAIAIAQEYVELAAEQERVERRAIASIRQRAQFTREEFDALQANNALRQRALGIGDEEQLQLQGTLAAMGVRKDALNEATEATIGLAEVTGGSLADASRVIAKVFAGEISALREYGIIVSTQEEAQHRLANLYQVTSVQSRTLETRLDSLRAAWGDLGEQLGAAITNSEEAKAGIDNLTSSIEVLQSVIADPALREASELFFGGMRDGIADVIELYVELRRFMAADRVSEVGMLGQTEAIRGLQVGQIAAIGNVLSQVSSLASVGGLAMFDADELQDSLVQVFEGLDPALVERDVDPWVSLLEKLREGTANAAFDGIEDGLARISQGAGAGLAGLETRMGAPTETPGGFLQTLATMRRRAGGGRRATEDEGLGAFEFGPKPLTGEALRMHLEEGMIKYLGGMTDAQAAFQEEMKKANALAKKMFDEAKEDRKRTQDAMIAQDQQFFGSMLSIATSSLSNFARAVATGSASIGEALRGMVGGIISSFGEMMIQLGSAAVLAGTLGTVAPIFAPGTGGPLGVGAGVALIAGGAAMVGIGAALGGRSGGAASTPTATPSSVGAPSRTRLPDSPFARGFEGGPGFGGAMQAAASTVVVNFNGIVDSRRAAREIRDVLGATG